MGTTADTTATRPGAGDAELERYGVIHEPPARDLQALTELAAQVCGVPHAAINLVTSDQQHQVAVAGIDASVCARDDSMCAAVLTDTRTVVVADASLDPRFARNPFVTGEKDEVRFYASAPLVLPSGTTIGRLCVFDRAPGDLTDQHAGLLRTVAERVVDVLELRLRSRQLEQSLVELTRARDDLRPLQRAAVHLRRTGQP